VDVDLLYPEDEAEKSFVRIRLPADRMDLEVEHPEEQDDASPRHHLVNVDEGDKGKSRRSKPLQVVMQPTLIAVLPSCEMVIANEGRMTRFRANHLLAKVRVNEDTKAERIGDLPASMTGMVIDLHCLNVDVSSTVAEGDNKSFLVFWSNMVGEPFVELRGLSAEGLKEVSLNFNESICEFAWTGFILGNIFDMKRTMDKLTVKNSMVKTWKSINSKVEETGEVDEEDTTPPPVIELRGLGSMRLDVTNLFPTFCAFNRTETTMCIGTYRSDFSWFKTASTLSWGCLWLLISIDMMAGHVGFIGYIGLLLSCYGDGGTIVQSCKQKVELVQALPTAFLMVYLLPSLLQAIWDGKWFRTNGMGSGIVAAALCMFTIKGDPTWVWNDTFSWEKAEWHWLVILAACNLVSILAGRISTIRNGLNMHITKLHAPWLHCFYIFKYLVLINGGIGLCAFLLAWAAEAQEGCVAEVTVNGTDTGESFFDACGGSFVTATSINKLALLVGFSLLDCCTGCCSNINPAQRDASVGQSLKLNLLRKVPLLFILGYFIADTAFWGFLISKNGWSGQRHLAGGSDASVLPVTIFERTGDNCDICTLARNVIFFGYILFGWAIAFLVDAIKVRCTKGAAERRVEETIAAQADDQMKRTDIALQEMDNEYIDRDAALFLDELTRMFVVDGEEELDLQGNFAHITSPTPSGLQRDFAGRDISLGSRSPRSSALYNHSQPPVRGPGVGGDLPSMSIYNSADDADDLSFQTASDDVMEGSDGFRPELDDLELHFADTWSQCETTWHSDMEEQESGHL